MIITVVLLHNDHMYQAPIETDGTVSFGSHKKDTVQVPDFAPGQVVVKWKKKHGLYINAKKAYSYERDLPQLDTILALDPATRTALYLSTQTSDEQETFVLPYNAVLKVGRTPKNDIVMNLPFISSTHFTLKCEAGVVRIEDEGSTNGVYVNGKKTVVAKLKSGDVITILGIRIVLENGALQFSNVGDALSIQTGVQDDPDQQSHIAGQQQSLHYKRSPRMQNRLPSEEIVLAAAPTKGQKYERSRGGMFGSLIGQGAMVGVGLMTTAVSPALLAARAASLITPVTSGITQGSANKQRKKNSEQYEAARRAKYGAYIEDQKARIESVAAEQREIITAENPEPRECVNVLYGLKRTLWERMPGNRDFLDVRIGMGYEDLCVEVRSRGGEGFTMEDDDVRELSQQIIEETRIVDNVPARLKLLQYGTIGMIGDRQKVIRMVRNMLISLTTSHCFEDVRIVGIFNEREREEWESMRWLPHVWDENGERRFLAFGEEEAHELCDQFNDLLRRRKDGLRNSSYGSASVPSPYYIMIFGDRSMMEREAIMENLFEDTPEMGVTSLFLYDDLYSLPPKCRFIVDLSNNPCAYDRVEANNKFMFTLDANMTTNQFDSFARRMSAVELEGFVAGGGLPDGITFLEGYGVKTVEELGAWERWNKSATYRSLGAPIGVMAGGKPFIFDIHEKYHGPHGLVAGTTGSGKSETLQSWILSMALNFHPHEVAFVIIDYKGGGMANLMEPLPHVIGKITNISSNIGRALVSLESESMRRQQIFEKYGVNHIDKYQMLYKEGKATEPVPHLILVSDEFAELKKAEPEFMAGLIQVARIGRSLGVHMVLATQKPGGVVDDQIQSNSRFRLCLKVADASDSREMIRRPDAASIRQAGRAYILVGHDEYFDQFQSYWSGAPYYGNAAPVQVETANEVKIVQTSGARIRPVPPPKKKKSENDELTACIEYLGKVAREHGVEKLPGPWLPELPDLLMADTLITETQFDGSRWHAGQKWLSFPIGMYDLPIMQQQGIQMMDLAEEGHYGIYGAPGTGKTIMLKSIAMSLCMHYTPEDVNLYVIDCGGWGMSSFANMPHVGGVALDCEEEKILKLEKLLMEEFESRKKLFLQNAVSSLAAYRTAVSADMPAIILMVDNLVPVFDNYPDLENLFVTISREGATYGFYLIYTANNTTGVRYKVLQNIRGAIAFELTDRGDYAGIVGRLDGVSAPKQQGRALFKGAPPVEFQAAMFIEGADDQQRNNALQDLIAKMNAAWSGKRPRPIPVMPEHVSVESMCQDYTERTRLPVGIGSENIQTAFIDLSDNYSMLVTGSMHSGKSAMLSDLFTVVTSREGVMTYVFDSRSLSLTGLKEKATHYAVCDDEAGVSAMLAELIDHLNTRKRAQNQSRQAQGDSLDEKAFIASYDLLCIIVDDLKDFIDSVSDGSRASMERICRLAQNLGVIFIAAGRVTDLSKYNEIESLTRVVVGNQNGIAMDGTPAQYSFFQNNLKYNERETEAGEGNGLLFCGGSCTKYKKME